MSKCRDKGDGPRRGHSTFLTANRHPDMAVDPIAIDPDYAIASAVEIAHIAR